MKASMCLIFILVSVGLAYATVGDFGGVAQGGQGTGARQLGAGALGGAGYGGRKGGVLSNGYDRGFSYGRGHDTAKTVNVGDEEFGGNGFGDNGMREYNLNGLGYGGMGYGGYRAPLFFFK